MNTPDYQPELPPEDDCDHGRDAWTLCDECLAVIIDDNGVLGRIDLIGMSAGLAVDLRDDGSVVIYMLHADTAVYGDGGVCYAWVTSDEQLTTDPDVVLAHPTEQVDIATEDLARFCELASDVATAFLPILEHVINTEVDPEVFSEELRVWHDERGSGPLARRFTLEVLHLLTRALMKREEQEAGS